MYACVHVCIRVPEDTEISMTYEEAGVYTHTHTHLHAHVYRCVDIGDSMTCEEAGVAHTHTHTHTPLHAHVYTVAEISMTFEEAGVCTHTHTYAGGHFIVPAHGGGFAYVCVRVCVCMLRRSAG